MFEPRFEYRTQVQQLVAVALLGSRPVEGAVHRSRPPRDHTFAPRVPGDPAPWAKDVLFEDDSAVKPIPMIPKACEPRV